MKMKWENLLTYRRLGVPLENDSQTYRSTFQKDFDRLIFSAAFRRLQDKTQVFPLAQTDYVRTRLTHSLEVSTVARSIGTMVGEFLVETKKVENFLPSDVGTILAASALAHDIGNPPFGHAGENGISQFFRENEIGQTALKEVSPKEQQDFLYFEGNAQAFRLLTKLQNSDNKGGMQLSLPTIGGFVKYPCSSSDRGSTQNIAYKKFNYFQSEKDIFSEFATLVGLLPYKEPSNDLKWCRHPFSFLLEAADDLCYSLIDIEDAYRLSLIRGEEVLGFYEKITQNYGGFPNKLNKMHREKDRIEYLRAFVMGLLINEVVEVFKENEESILAGTFNVDLLVRLPSSKVLSEIKTYAYDHIYVSKPVLEVGIAGLEIIEELLSAFVGAMNQEVYFGSTAKSRMLKSFLPDQFIGLNRTFDEDPYLRVLKITDFISGMTDRYAVHIYKMISGAHLTT